jgi:transketolase
LFALEEKEATFVSCKTYANAEFKCGLRDLTVEQAHQYLIDRAAEVGQKTLDMERQAIQSMMQNVTGKLGQTEKLDVIKSEHKQILSSRSYTNEQIQMVVNAQTERNALATEIAHAAGLRAHELHTLQRIEERKPDPRPALKEKFTGRDGERYTVKGKGVSYMENSVGWHGKAPNDEEYAIAMEDLKKEGEALCQK